MTTQPRAIVVGCGYFGAVHLKDWIRLGERVRIEAVVDVDEDAAARCAAQFQIPRVFHSYEEALDAVQPDFVDIVTRPALHLDMARRAADRGIAVLCQKPLAPTWEESVEMVRYCNAKGVRLMANENWRWQRWYRELRGLIDAGVAGRPFYFTLRHRTNDGAGDSPYPRQPYFPQMPRLLLVETMIHFLDTARFLVGDLSMKSCEARRVNPVIRGDDVVVMVLEGAGGLMGVVDGNRLSQPEHAGLVMGDARIEGDKATLSLLGDGRIFVRPVHGEPYEHRYDIPTHGYRGDSVYAVLGHFLHCLATGAAFESSGEDYLKTTQLIFDGYRLAGW